MLEEVAQRPCGRPTKSGTPCRAQHSGPGFACKIHTTEREKEIVEAYQRGLTIGRTEGSDWEKKSAKLSVEHLERRVQDLEAKLDAATRRYQDNGHQAVTVDGYGYRWEGHGQLAVGDRYCCRKTA